MSGISIEESFDCIVVGSGHAGSCAALSASQSGCRKVLLIEKCPKEWVGGNGYFTAGAFRTCHDGVQDLLPLVKNVTPETAGRVEMDPYSKDNFIGDIMRMSGGKSDPALTEALVQGSRDAISWLAEKVEVPFIFSFHRQAYEVDGKQRFWGGMVLGVENGGKGLIAAHQTALSKAGVDVWFDAPVTDLLTDDRGVIGVVVMKEGELTRLKSPAVVLAAGGFEASREMRETYLGQQWVRAKVRGTGYNTGECLTMAIQHGACPSAGWDGCHSTCWDARAPDNAGERGLTNQFTKSGYPLGLMLNSKGLRFVDEGSDFRNFTYAAFGRAILNQPGGTAFQIWDHKVLGWLRREEYGEDVVQRIVSDDIRSLAEKLRAHGLEDSQQFIATVQAFNSAVVKHRKEFPALAWNPAVKDSLSTQSSLERLELPKSNWALPIDQPPFVAVKVTCGITFTFGGLVIDPISAGVIDTNGKVIQGLFCAGEMVGGLFYENYPGGSGLTAGAVFGRKAGEHAAALSGP